MKDLSGLPIMHFERRKVDFGKVKKGEKREHTFHFTNTGEGPLTIDIISACDCTTVEYERGKTWQPGESGDIHVIFDSSSKDEGETITIDIILRQTAGKEQYPIIESLQYTFELEN